MADPTQLIEAVLDSLPNGLAVISGEGQIVFWNRTAEAITGYGSAALVGRTARDAIETVVLGGEEQWQETTGAKPAPKRGWLFLARHRQGHSVPILVRLVVLRDGMGRRIGGAAVFHAAESMDALPHGEYGENQDIRKSQADFEERVEECFAEFQSQGAPLGVLWIMVDQARDLRKTHGAKACEEMLEKMEETLLRGLRPSEEIGRWGEDEFLIVSHEPTPEMLAAHGQRLAAIARNADFRWWGDRVALTVSIGGAQAVADESLGELLGRAQAAMIANRQESGSAIAVVPGGQQCS